MSTPQKTQLANPYARPPEAVREPPKGLWQTLKFLGPSFILIGSIVGSGELILTTSFGAKVGFLGLWFVLLSCIVKTVIQAELGRYTISSGDTCLQAFDKVPGPRYRSSWLVWLYVLSQIPNLIAGSAILGSAGQVLAVSFPNVPQNVWAVAVAVVTAVILLRGRYESLERTSLFLVLSFTFITVLGAIALQFTPSAVSWQEALHGLRIDLKPLIQPLTIAMTASVFAATGVGGGELMAYAYWCVEKGYARYAGESDGSEAWVRRARGWIKVMQTDVWLATGVFTASTLAFFLLGAGILHRQGLVPDDKQMITTIQTIYTNSLGDWASLIFLVGAFFVLYSTLFSGTAGMARVYADILGVLKVVDFSDFERRLKWIRFFIVAIPATWITLYLSEQRPHTVLVMASAMNGLVIPVIALTTIWLRFRQTDKCLRPNRATDTFLFACSAITIAVTGAYLYLKVFPDLLGLIGLGQ